MIITNQMTSQEKKLMDELQKKDAELAAKDVEIQRLKDKHNEVVDAFDEMRDDYMNSLKAMQDSILNVIRQYANASDETPDMVSG